MGLIYLQSCALRLSKDKTPADLNLPDQLRRRLFVHRKSFISSSKSLHFSGHVLVKD
jgi:hypothetical protein